MEKLRRCPRRWLWGWPWMAVCLILGAPVMAQPERDDPGPPAWLELQPNAIQRQESMTIVVGGIPQGGVVRLRVLRDCDGDGEPELQDMEECRSPLYVCDSEPAKSDNVVTQKLTFSQLEAEGRPLPRNTALWLRASRPGSRLARQVIFGLVDKPCSLFKTVVDTFLGGKCDPHLAQALLQHRSDSKLEDVTFEVRLLDVDGEATEEGVEATSVPGTLGATGVSWLDETTLIVTVAATAFSGEEGEGPRPAEPGLYRISFTNGERERLWAPDPGDLWRPVAPLPLPGGGIALARQRLGTPPAGEPVALLHVWRDGELDGGIPLPYKVHQLVATNRSGDSVLALTLGREDSHPAFLEIDLDDGMVEYLGYHHGLYHAATRSPVDDRSVIAAEDITTGLRWFLILVDGQGKWVKDLQMREGLHDVQPAWRPDGRQVAILGELSTITSTPTTIPRSSPPDSEVDAASEADDLSDETPLDASVFERLLKRLEDVPARWQSIGEPRVPISGKLPGEILIASSEEEDRRALDLISELTYSPVEERSAVIRIWLEKYEPTEVDLWLPALVAQQEQVESLEDAALITEAWMQWSEALGRRDALLMAAGFAIDMALLRIEFSEVLRLCEPWIQLPTEAGLEQGKGKIAQTYAGVLALLGNHEEALGAYRTAQALFALVDDQLGEGNTLEGEAKVLFMLGRHDEALNTFRKARTRFTAVGDQLGEGNAWNGEAKVLFLLGRNDEALNAHRIARVLFEAAGDQLGQGNALEGEADVHFRTGEYEKALEAYGKAGDLFEIEGDRLGRASALRAEGDARFRLGENEKALEAIQRARDLYEAIGSPQGITQTFVSEAEILFRRGENEAALEMYRQTREVFAEMGDSQGQGHSWDGEAEILAFRGEYEQALEAYRTARGFFEAAGEKVGQGNTFRGEAAVLFLQNENEEALQAYRKARALFAEVGDLRGQANTLGSEARVLFRFEEYDQALGAHEDARRLFEKLGDLMGQGNTWVGEADIRLILDDTENALEAYRQAREFFEGADFANGQGDTWLGEANVLSERGQYEKALEIYQETQERFEIADDKLGLANSLYHEARLLLRRLGNAEGAASKAAESAAHFNEQGDLSGRLFALLLEAQARDQLGQTEDAARLAGEAIRLHTLWRTSRITDQHRVQIEDNIAVAYHILVPLKARQKEHTREALTLAEEARSRVLLDLLRDRQWSDTIADSETSIPDLLEERRHIDEQLALTEQRFKQEADPGERRVLEEKLRRFGRALIWNQYQRVAASETALKTTTPMDTDGIANMARQTGPILLYYVTESKVVGFLIRPQLDSPLVRFIDIGWDDLSKKTSSLVRDLANTNLEARAAAQSRELWQLLIDPFAEHLPPSGALVLIPHGPLHLLPFEALLDSGDSPLFERWQLSVAPSVSALKIARERHVEPREDDTLLAFSGGHGLVHTRHEAQEISHFFTEVHHADSRFSVYQQEAGRAQHIFTATRGLLEKDSQTGTYLEFLAEEGHGPRLTALEIATISLQAELVTLSACDTAAAQALLSDERLDLTRAFLVAGAASVLATRWKVPDDERTSRFLIDFYRAYRTGGPDGEGLRKDEALNEARRLSRDRGDPAAVWAAWVLLGDSR